MQEPQPTSIQQYQQSSDNSTSIIVTHLHQYNYHSCKITYILHAMIVSVEASVLQFDNKKSIIFIFYFYVRVLNIPTIILLVLC